MYIIKIIMKLWLKIKYSFIRGSQNTSRIIAKQIVEDSNLKTISDISEFVQRRMKYVSDPLLGFLDIQQDLEYTSTHGWKGDCDDYALAAYRLAEAMGQKPFLLTMINKDIRKNHVVCYGEYDGRVYLIGTEGYRIYNNLNELLNSYNTVAHSLDKV